MRVPKMASLLIFLICPPLHAADALLSAQCVQEYEHGRLEKALYYCHGAAPDPQAQYILGKIYSIEGSHSPEMQKAFEYFSAAALQKQPDAEFMLALCYQNGIGVPKDIKKAAQWYQQANLHGLKGPHFNLHWLRKSDNHNMAQYFPGANELKNAMNLEKTEKEASLHWYNSAAEKGNIEAEYRLGLFYAHGKNLPQNDGKALLWLNKAAEKNHQDAQAYLAWMCALGLGRPENKEEAIHWFILASQNPPESQEGVSKNLDSVFRTFHERENNLADRSPESEYLQGIELFESQLSEYDHIDGLTLLEKAADENYAPAQLYLAKLYHEGVRVKRDLKKALELYLSAANNREPEAQYALGWMYFYGEGVPQNNEEAYEWFNRAYRNEAKAKEAMEFIETQRSIAQVEETPSPIKVKMQRAKDYLKLLLPSKKPSAT